MIEFLLFGVAGAISSATVYTAFSKEMLVMVENEAGTRTYTGHQRLMGLLRYKMSNAAKREKMASEDPYLHDLYGQHSQVS